MDNSKGLMGIKRTNRMPNAFVRELCEVTNGVDERNDECSRRYPSY